MMVVASLDGTITVELSAVDRDLLKEILKALRGPDYGKIPQVWCGSGTYISDKTDAYLVNEVD